jgi:hypothetical protein
VIYIAAATAPAQTPPIPLRLKEWSQLDDQAKSIDGAAALTVAWPASGGLDIGGTLRTSLSDPLFQGDPEDLDPEDLLGHHLVVFP